MSDARLREALEHADLRVLLMAVYHRTGDPRWLEAPFRPRRDVRLIADEEAGLSEEARSELLASALALFSESKEPAFRDPGDARMREMMSACLGEEVPAEYAPMMREELAFTSRDVAWSGDTAPDTAGAVQVLIVGAGASGIALGARLERLGIPYTIVERNADLGGTWYENRYPGCGVDTPNHAYSFSEGERYPWPRYFSAQPQLLDYLQRAADAFGVLPRIRFRCSVTAGQWDEARSQWTVRLQTTSGEETLRCEYLVSAIGQFGAPSLPEIPGAERFRGERFHSAAWPSDLELDGRRVALIGTGASAMQIAPTIRDRVASLAIYQRSAQWARPIPRYHDHIPEPAQRLLREIPFYAEWLRFTMLWRYGDGLLRFLKKDPEWPHAERSLNRTNERHRQEMTAHIVEALGERTDLREACIPSYPPYGKRILLDNGWFETLRAPHVELVTEAIDCIDETGIATRDGHHRECDVLVYATGFHMTQMTSRLGLRGRDGLTLAEAWRGDDPRAYLGVSVPGFPNCFLMLGPNTGLGHGGSSIAQSECQARYITSLLVQAIESGARSVGVRRSVHDQYNARVDAEHETLIWTHPGMSTYYRNARGRVFSVMPWRIVDYWQMTHDADLSDYHVSR